MPSHSAFSILSLLVLHTWHVSCCPYIVQRLRSRKKVDLAELSEKSAAMRERMHVPFHTLSGSADESDAPVNLLEQAESELSGEALI